MAVNCIGKLHCVGGWNQTFWTFIRAIVSSMHQHIDSPPVTSNGYQSLWHRRDVSLVWEIFTATILHAWLTNADLVNYTGWSTANVMSYIRYLAWCRVGPEIQLCVLRVASLGATSVVRRCVPNCEGWRVTELSRCWPRRNMPRVSCSVVFV